MELAHEHPRRAAGVAHDGCTPVAAGVAEGTDGAVLAPHQQHGIADDVAQLVRAGLGELAVVGGVQPHRAEEVFPLELVELEVGVATERDVRQRRKSRRRRAAVGLVRRPLAEPFQVALVHGP